MTVFQLIALAIVQLVKDSPEAIIIYLVIILSLTSKSYFQGSYLPKIDYKQLSYSKKLFWANCGSHLGFKQVKNMAEMTIMYFIEIFDPKNIYLHVKFIGNGPLTAKLQQITVFGPFVVAILYFAHFEAVSQG